MKHKKRVCRRILSFSLAMMMCIPLQGMNVFAATVDMLQEEGDTATAVTTVTDFSGEIAHVNVDELRDGESDAESSESEQKASVEELQKIEKAIVRGLRQRKNYIPLEGYQATATELSGAFGGIGGMICRFPQYYISGYVFVPQQDTDMVAGLSVQYSLDAEEASKRQKEMEQAASEIVNKINSSPREMKDYEKAWLVCQWLAEECEYDPNYDPKAGMNVGDLDPESYTAYGALVKKVAVCDGYSRAYQYIMRDLLGIPCLRVASSTHAWNMVKIDGKYYHVDVTWSRNADKAPSGDFFLLTDEELLAADKTHHSTWNGPYDMEKGDGPSFMERNPLWNILDLFSYTTRSSGLTYYEGCWYFASYGNICRVADLLDYEMANRQCVCHTDATYSELWSKASPFTYTSIFEYHDCLYFHGKQRIYRLNLADKSEEERMIDPGNHMDLAEDITLQTVSTFDREMWTLLDVDNALEKKDPTKFIWDFKMEKNEDNEGRITFQVLNNKPLRPYYYLPITLNGEIEVTGELGVGQKLTATPVVSSSLKPMYHNTAQAYYRWYRDDFLICRNTSGTYTVTEEDIGKTLRVVLTYDNYDRELSKEIGTIPKMVPVLPDELPSITGEQANTLEKIALPEGYEWKEPDTVLEEVGKHRYPITYCPDSEKYETIEASLEVEVKECNHIWDNGRVTKAARCLTPGEKTFTCSRCKGKKIVEIPARGTEHRWNGGTITKEATCAEEGSQDFTCMVCSEKKTEIIEKTTSHRWKTTGEVTKKPTATERGSFVRTCSVCNSQKTEELLYATTGNFVSGMTYLNVRSSAKAVNSNNILGKLKKNVVISVIENGSTSEWTKICYNNRTAYVMSKYVVKGSAASKDETPKDETPKTGSNVTVGKATYKVTNTNTVEFTKVSSTASGTVTIPASVKIKGKTYKVTSVAAKLMKNNKKVKKVVIGSNITKIGAEAFRGCKNLKTITIKSSKLKSVGKNAIKGIHKKAKITCPKKKKASYKKLFKSKTGYKKTMKIK